MLNQSCYYCSTSDPRDEWGFCLYVLGVMYILFSIIYFSRILQFLYKNSFYSICSLLPQVIFAISFLVNGSLNIIRANSYKHQIFLGVFKFLISDLSKYITDSSLSLILYSWCFNGSYCYIDNSKIFKKIKSYVTFFNIIIFFMLGVLLCIRSLTDDSTLLKIWSIAKSMMSVLCDLLLCVLYFLVLRIMKKNVGFGFTCDFGKPIHYFYQISCFVMIFKVIQIFCNISFFILRNLFKSECTEKYLLYFILSECLNGLLPSGFISVVDVISLPPPNKIMNALSLN